MSIRYALRGLRRSPGFTATVSLTLALGIGANAATTGLVERLMFAAPPGVQEPDRVVRVAVSFSAGDNQSFTMSTMSYPDAQAIARLDGAFVAVAAFRADTVTSGRGADLTGLAAVKASGRYFATL